MPEVSRAIMLEGSPQLPHGLCGVGRERTLTVPSTQATMQITERMAQSDVMMFLWPSARVLSFDGTPLCLYQVFQ